MNSDNLTATVNVKVTPRFDSNDITYYSGLLLLGIGLAFGVSWQTALIVVGSILAVVSLVNSYVLVWMNNK
jgi:uncharacterized membrane protein